MKTIDPNKKIQVSVGISAYNEEKNIKNLIIKILFQNRENWNLKEILVYSDNSTDKTASKVREIKSSLIKLTCFNERRGKVFRINELLHDFSGDILIIFDADLTLKDNDIINNLLKPFLKDHEVMLVGGNTRPYGPKSFFQKAVYSTFIVFDKSRKKIKNGNNIFGCTGGCLAIKREFGKTLTLPDIRNEDDYLYFSCLLKGYKFRHQSRAVAYYKLPNNLKDYLKQVFRSNPEAVSLNIKKYFGKLVDEEYHRPFLFYFQSILEVFVKYPLEVIYIISVNAVCKLFFPIVSKHYKLSWYTAESSK